MPIVFRGRSDFALRTVASLDEDHRFFAECRLLNYLGGFRYFSAFPNRKVFPMNASTVEALSTAARTGITVINLDGSTRRIRGATA